MPVLGWQNKEKCKRGFMVEITGMAARLEPALSSSSMPYRHDINFPVINKSTVGGKMNHCGIRGRITAVLPALFLFRSWGTAGGEKRSSHMWELVRELSQVQRLRVSLVYFSQAQSAVERLRLCDSSPEVIRREEHFGFRQRGCVDGRDRPGKWWAMKDV